MWKVAVLVASTAIGTVGCSAVQEPIIDKTGVDNGHYSRDLAECFNTIPFFCAGQPCGCLHGRKRVPNSSCPLSNRRPPPAYSRPFHPTANKLIVRLQFILINRSANDQALNCDHQPNRGCLRTGGSAMLVSRRASGRRFICRSVGVARPREHRSHEPFVQGARASRSSKTMSWRHSFRNAVLLRCRASVRTQYADR
jgi:hypothetical protein